ncbi:MAG: PD-(D/E)XK nuclease family protein [archaeon]|nr:PD-(D/E)XK nuclease family protein [archaeon]
MRLAKSIDELYDEVKNYDMVLCNDAPLALALNNRINIPRIGIFAITPLQLASTICEDILGTPTLSDVEVIRVISKNTGYKFGYVHSEIQNFKTIRRYTKDVKKHLHGRRSKVIYDEYIQLPTLEKAMSTFSGQDSTFFTGKKIAVIGADFYDQLDKNFNPPEGKFDYIEVFKNGEYIIPEIRELNNSRQIAENATSLITLDNAADTAVVFNVEESIADSVRSALYRKKIPFKNFVNVKDLSPVRKFLEFITLSFSFNTVKVSQVRELISSYGGFISERYDEYLIENFSLISRDKKTNEIIKIMQNIEKYTYLDICNKIAGAEKEPIETLLDELDIANTVANSTDTDNIIYAVNNVSNLKHNEQVPDSEKEGVLLVDCKNSVYIDRPIVIYLGLGTEWEIDLNFLNVISYGLKQEENDKNIQKFQILLQQGSERIYICSSTKNGIKPKPCSYFDQIENRHYETFNDVCEKFIPGNWCIDENLKFIMPNEKHVCLEYIPKSFSKSSFNNFISCPRKYMLASLLGSQDNSSTILGSLLHEYIEFRVCYPEIATKYGIEHYVDTISNAVIGLFPAETRSIKISNIRNSIKNINEFVDKMNFSNTKILGNCLTRHRYNRFFEETGKETLSNITEVPYESKQNHMKGIFDIIVNNTIFDFKTGSAHDAKSVKDRVSEEFTTYDKEYQCMFYLSLLDEICKEGEKSFILFYTAANEGKDVAGIPYDIHDNVVTIKKIGSVMNYIREIFLYEIGTAKSFGFLRGSENLYANVIESIGFDAILKMNQCLIDKFQAMKLNKTNATALAKKVRSIISESPAIFVSDDKKTLYVTDEYLARFKSLVLKSFDSLENMFFNEFPMIPTVNCSMCGFKDICISSPGVE